MNKEKCKEYRCGKIFLGKWASGTCGISQICISTEYQIDEKMSQKQDPLDFVILIAIFACNLSSYIF
jgi:hypothetical protein